MKDDGKLDKFLLEQPLRTRGKFLVGKINAILALLVLVTILILVIYYWNSLAWYFKLILGFVIVVLSPSMEDFRFIAKSYDVYVAEWRKNNDKNDM